VRQNMVMQAFNQTIAKRKVQKHKPVFTLIVNPNFKPRKTGKIKRFIASHFKFKLKLLKRRKAKLITIFLLIIISITLFLLCFPAYSQNSEMQEFNFSGKEDMIINLLHHEMPLNAKSQAFNSDNLNSLKRLKTSLYKVKNGDNLFGIAKEFGLDLGTIISFNKMKNGRSLKVGSQLEVPNHNGLRYLVKPGDSLSNISQKFNISLNNILDWNNLETSVIIKGQVIFLPGAKMSMSEINEVIGKLFIYPTNGILSSGFGWRNSPFTGIREFHKGIDLRNIIGTKVVASREGKVSKIGYDPIYGNYIIIAHNDGFHTLYGHLKTIIISKGDYVNQGQKIATMGTTGLSTGSHLHFSIFKKGKAINPFVYLK
jgi:murein DD-endopeptidase MepM/ murein hydrolase activator NlpD